MNLYILALYTIGREAVDTTRFTIENIVVTTKIADAFDLDHVSRTFPDSHRNPAETSLVVIHKTTPVQAAVMIFPNGTLMCTGTKTIHDTETIIHTTIKLLHAAGFPVKENPEILVQSIVASQELQKKIDLSALAKSLGVMKASYNPSEFPGLIYKKNDNHNISVLLFDTGKIVCTGTNVDDVTRAFEHITNDLLSYGIK
ncbi:MAG: hypothetical protein V1726_00445 [Methanobacteriota archaeon]